MDWKPEYCVGIEEIDRQHKVLFSHFTMVEEAFKEGNGWSQLHYELLALAEYAKYHFHFEESLMRLFGFGGLEGHVEQHKFYADRINKKIEKTLTEEVKEELFQLLERWVIDHITGTDRVYVEYIVSGASVVLSNESPTQG